MYEHLLYEVADGIATININNPKSLNALDPATIEEFGACIEEVAKDKAVKALIVTGAGPKSFVAGADISKMVLMSAEEGARFAALADGFFSKLEALPIVTIAAVNGYALGGGCELAMACDIRIASENAIFGQPEVGLGIIPGFGGTQRLARLIGKGRAKELILTTDRIDANEAYRIGLVNKVTSKEELIDTCKAMIGRVLKNGPFAVAVAKSCIESGMDMDLKNGLKLEADAFGLTFATEEKKEGMTAFLEKRKANFG
jgi:enoyl-CoA hydratase